MVKSSISSQPGGVLHLNIYGAFKIGNNPTHKANRRCQHACYQFYKGVEGVNGFVATLPANGFLYARL
jgi:hypothetical protein